jgi:hypothetical protein
VSDSGFLLPDQIPLEDYPPPDVFIEEARSLIDDGEKQGMVLRALGPVALHLHFPQQAELYRRMERLPDRVFSDADLMAYGRARQPMVDFMQAHGYQAELELMMMFGKERHLYYGGRVPIVNIFFDRLDMNHCVDFTGRLEIHRYAASLTDLLLQKLQIWEITDKDLKDAMFLLVCAPVGDSESAMINAGYVARLLSDDWGFYHTATTNLKRIKETAATVPALNRLHRATIASKADQLLFRLEAEPKTKNWRRRAERGESRSWYKPVTEW